MDELGRELDLRARARHEFEAGPLSREEFTATVAEIDDEIARLQAAQPVAPPPPSLHQPALSRESLASTEGWRPRRGLRAGLAPKTSTLTIGRG